MSITVKADAANPKHTEGTHLVNLYVDFGGPREAVLIKNLKFTIISCEAAVVATPTYTVSGLTVTMPTPAMTSLIHEGVDYSDKCPPLAIRVLDSGGNLVSVTY